MYFMYVVQYIESVWKKIQLARHQPCNLIQHFKKKLCTKYFDNVKEILLGTILFFRVCIENKRVHFFFNSDSLCWKPSIPTCLSTFNPEVTLSCFYQWSEWWWQIFSLVFMCGTHLFKKLLLLLLVVVVVVSF